MPRKSRGGSRQGTPGTAYANRTDLNAAKTQPIQVAPAGTYGEATAQRAAQQAIPLPGPGAGVPSSPQQPGPGAAPQSPGPAPGGLGGLADPTTRPGEPLTAGLASGPGPGPEAIGGTTPADPTVAMLKGILSQYPNADLQALIAEAESRATP